MKTYTTNTDITEDMNTL